MSKTTGAEPIEAAPTGFEPIRRPWLWIGVIVLLLAGVPWYVPRGTIEPIVLGLPLWAWGAIGSTVAMSGYLHWAITHRWMLVEEVEERIGTSIGPDTDLPADIPTDGPRGR